LFDLNSEHLDPNVYFRILDNQDQQQVGQSDYDRDSCDIIPTSSPEDVSNAQKMVKAQILYSLKGQGFNDMEINKRFIEAMQLPDAQTLLQAPPPPPDPKVVLETRKLDIEQAKFEFEAMKFQFEIAKIESEIMKNIAEAEAKEVGPQLEHYKIETQALIAKAKAQAKPEKTSENNRGGLQ